MRIEIGFKRLMLWAQVRRLMESVASMSEEDRGVMSQSVGGTPFKTDSFGLALCHRARLYWPTWELKSSLDALVNQPDDGQFDACGSVSFFWGPSIRCFLKARMAGV